jgi:hypothetical protein
MQALKIVLSVLALLVGAAAGVTQIGGWNVTPAVTELLLSVGAALALFGVTPITVPPLLARVFGAISVVTIGAIAAHAGAEGGSSLLVKVAGFAAILLGLVAKFPMPQKAAAGAVVLWLALGAAVAPGCDCAGDDWPIYRCAGARSAGVAKGEIICYEPDGTPFRSRRWVDPQPDASPPVPGDTPETACEFCEGFLPPFDGGQ